MLLADIVEASTALTATRSRKAKVAVLAGLLLAARPHERGCVVAFLAGVPPQGRIGTGWRTLATLGVPPASESGLTVAEVDRGLTEIAATSGAGSAARRTEVLGALFGRATEPEQWFLSQLLTGELRQGALEGVM
ncbi:MAG: ATP-dependent DNA ligase, partial [Haloechinothrix sp.]